MNSKLWFLAKMSLKKKVKTKWFLIANLIFLILIAGLINIDSIIKLFGGDFNDTLELLVIDNANVYRDFETNYLNNIKYINDYGAVKVIKYDKTYNEAIEEVKADDKLLVVIEKDSENYLKAKVVSNDEIGTITNTIIQATLTNIRSEIVLTEYNITKEMFNNINNRVEIENIILSNDNFENSMMVSTIMQIITFPVFMLIIFLVQMIGAEVNEEKTTKSMEIIISNVSPKTHFISKIIASNGFVLIQGLLLIIFVILGIGLRFIIGGSLITTDISGEINNITNMLDLASITNSIGIILPIMIIMIILTFIAYSLLAGILASMTTNLEDYQQLQTPIVVISLVGYYLSVMAGMFKGSLFIRIMSYIPFISSMLAPTLYVIGEITIFDLIGSIILLIGIIYLLIKYGLRIYKAGILNYSGTGLWKKMFKAMKEKWWKVLN